MQIIEKLKDFYRRTKESGALLRSFDFVRRNKRPLVLILIIVLIIVSFGAMLPPSDFSVGKIVTIEQGQTMSDAAETLKENRIIRSKSSFGLIVSLSRKHVVEGDYFFPEKMNLFQVFKKITSGTYEIPTKKVTLFEGMTVRQMAEVLKELMTNFDANGFIELALEHEGYLFPDTYEFNSNVSPEEVIKLMRENFNQQIEDHSEQIEDSKYSLEEIVIMASIIEKEASRSTIQEISDILWHRMEIGMALQVDAPFVYAINKGTFDLTSEDLREDHEYNTYTRPGLTPTPISNPGMESILAAANPQKTPYLYFLTGNDGEMYFAMNFEQHKRNKALYLK
jgi:UPF0755 protein